ncbi:unnamed protein product [Gongylonema pulchrum]|uniref:PH domain-containing protein n=1 Tax=Gongylonema pulchrum TaxID=637853 RepID=A0A183E2K5_9BILA|nr:unnamed protein product [Gongylonema pulchrum]
MEMIMDVPEDEWFDVIEDGGLDKAEENEYFDVAGLTEVVKRGSCGEWRKQLWHLRRNDEGFLILQAKELKGEKPPMVLN